MRNIYTTIIILFVLFGSFIQAVRGQCPATVPTFSSGIPGFPADRTFALFDAVHTSSGKLAGIGLKKDAEGSPWELYFVSLDSDGQIIGSPKQITPPAGLPIVWDSYDTKAVFFTEAFNASGGAIGYFAAVNLGDANDEDIWAVLLSPQGCVVWGKRLGTPDDGKNDKALGVFRTPDNEYVILGERHNGLTGSMVIHTFDISGTACDAYEFPNSFVPSAMTPVTQGFFGTAKWAVCGINQTSNMPAILLLDSNFEEINDFGDAFTPNQNSAAPHIPVDLVQRNNNLYVLGYAPSNNGKGWMSRLSYAPSGASDLIVIYSTQIDLPNDPAYGVQRDVPWDIEVKSNDTLAIGGWSHYTAVSNPYRPWLMTLTESGILIQSKRMTDPGANYGLLHKVLPIPGRGYFLAGQKWNSSGAADGTQALIAGCDKNLVTGNCICNEDQPVSLQFIVGEIIGSFNYPGGTSATCAQSDGSGSCADDENTRQICFAPANPGCSVVIYLEDFDPCTGEATLSAETSGMDPQVGFTWTLFNGQTSTSQTVQVTFPSSGDYSFSVGASDGNCNASVTQVITVEFDAESPQIICPSSKIVNGILLPGGGCAATVFGLNPQITDDCPPINLTYSLSGATTGSGTGDASGISFNQGVTLITYTATDNLGLSSDCSFSIEVSCDNLDLFNKIYGDENPNRPTRIKAFGDHVFVAGVTQEMGELYGTFSKFDPATGNLIWDIQLSFPSSISDFEFFPASESNLGLDGFILVGRTEPADSGGQPVNNQSIIFRVNDVGAAGNLGSLMREYQLTGREGFTRIVKHPNPANPAFPFYVAGVKNTAATPAPPSESDVVFLMNINQDGMENFVREYNYAADDDEFHRGLIALQDGNLLLTGNERPSGDGVLVKINGSTGTVMNAYTLSAPLNIYDGIQLPGGAIVLAGAHTALNEAFAATLLPDLTVFQSLRFPDVVDFREISFDAMGRVYAAGEIKPGALPAVAGRQAIHRLLIGSPANPTLALDQGISWYLEDKNQQETSWANPHLWVRPDFDLIFYADARKQINPSPGFGDFDILAGSFDLDFNSLCRYEFPQSPIALSFSRLNATMTAQAPIPPHAFTSGFGAGGLNFLCDEFCTGLCVASFTWEPAGCFEIAFEASLSGEPPFDLEWDFAGLGSSSLANPEFLFPGPGTYTVCLTLTDGTGCQAEYCVDIEVTEDLTPFTLTCAPNQTVFTLAGQCHTPLNPVATIEDDCAPEPVVTYELTGATTGIEPDTIYEKGLTIVTAKATDGNQTLTCNTQITVVDQEDPKIECPSVAPVAILACDQEAQVFFDEPTVSDNCPGVEFSCDFESGGFFPCGTTYVTCTATDSSGNTAECFFPVEVSCDCAEILSTSLACVPDEPNLFEFTIELLNLSGSNTCGLTVVNSQEGETVLTVTSSGPFNNFGVALVEGTIEIVGATVPATFELLVEISCLCSPGNFETCTLPLSMPVICCEQVEVPDLDACETEETLTVPINPISALSNIKRVTWYVKPCSEPSFSDIPYQDTPTDTLTPLILYPAFLGEDVCVYAVVHMDNPECALITSNQATIHLCRQGEWTASSQDLCYSGSPVEPGPISVSSPSGCGATEVAWYDPEGNLVETGGMTFQPVEPLSMTNPEENCYEDFYYKAVITGPCGEQEVEALVRLYSSEAPKGKLSMDPLEDLPLCAGGDITLRFEPACLGESGSWTWKSGTDDANYVPIAGSGANNEVWHSNGLAEDTWFVVETHNGSCPADTARLFVEVQPAPLGNFTVTYDDPCDPKKVNLEVFFTPVPDCEVSIEWYRNGQLIHTTMSQTTSPASFLYSGSEIDGYYYILLKNSCCNEVYQSPAEYLPKPAYAVVHGPCFRCGDEEVVLTGEVVNLEPGAVCNYQWTTLGGLIEGVSDTEEIVAGAGGTYIFTANCGDCTYSADISFACSPLGIGGNIAMETGQDVRDVLVDLNTGLETALTDQQGNYLFENLASGGDYTLTPMLDTLPANGVTTFDMVLIMRHILNVQLLDSPYKIIAADANRSGTVTTLDLVAIRRVILVVEEGFPGNTSWRFVDADYVFPDPTDPFNPGFPEYITYEDLQVSELETDFVAVKTGDVNNSADTDLAGGTETRHKTGQLIFRVPDTGLEPGQVYEASFYGGGREVFGYQFTLELAEGLELAYITGGVAREEHFGVAQLDKGALTVSWNEAHARLLGAQEKQFSLGLRASKAGRLSEQLRVSSRFTRSEAYGPDGEMLDIRLAFEPAQEDGFALYQNIPNPFTGETRIGFLLPEAGFATLTVSDATGRVLQTMAGEYEKGYNEVVLKHLAGAGVLYYRLSTAAHQATRKMVMLE